MASFQFEDNSDKFKRTLAEKIPVILEGIGIEMERAAKKQLEASPRRVDTGFLRNSVTHAVSGNAPAISAYHGDNPSKYDAVQAVPIGFYSGTAPSDSPDKQAVYIGSNVEYAVYVSEGTQNMKPNRFLKNAIEKNKNQIKQYIENGLMDS